MWATGTKTLDERISQGPSSAIDVPGKNLPTVLERAQKQGKKIGNVTTAELTDATPAVLDSHISLRGCQGPADADTLCKTETKAAGGLGSIAEQTVDHRVDVALGGGRNRFAQTITGGHDAGKTVEQSAARQGITEVNDAAGLAAAKRSDRPLLGLFAPVNMTTEWNGPVATRGDGTPAQRCKTDNRPANEPSLPAMTQKAIDLLLAGRPRRLLPPGRGRLDRQAGPRGERVRADRRDDRVRQRDQGRAGVRAVASRHADRGHRRPRAHVADRGRGHERHRQPDGLLEQPHHRRRPDAPRHVRHGRRRDAARGPAEPAAHRLRGARSVRPGPGAAAVLGTTDHTDLFEVLGGGHGRR